MKTFRRLFTVGALALALGLGSLVARGAGTNTVSTPGTPAQPPHRPPSGDKHQRTDLPAEVKQLMDQYRQAANAFRDKQNQLAKQLKDATAEERDRIKDQLIVARQQFRDLQLMREREIRDRLNDLRNQFMNQRDQVINAAQSQIRDHRGR